MADAKGIIAWVSNWFDNAINTAEGTGMPGPEKKQSVLDRLFELLEIGGALKGIIEWAMGLIIDALVRRKNDTGEFTHGGE